MFKHLVLAFAGTLLLSACSGDKGNATAAPTTPPANTAPAAAPAPAAAAPTSPAPTAAATPAAGPRQWELGADYQLIDPRVPTSTGDKIEVVEVFSYACPHCAHFQPTMDELKKKLPSNAQVVLIPAVFHQQWEPFARAFYTAQSMGVLDKTHQALFDAIYTQHLPLNSIDTLANGFYAGQGVNPSTFLSVANSFVIDSKLARGQQLMKDYGITGTPTIIVNGKYRVGMDVERNIGPQELIDIVLLLVKQEADAKK